jgi:PKD domain-containing protein
VASSNNNDTTTTTIATGVTATTTLPAATTTTTTTLAPKAGNRPPTALLKVNPDPPTGQTPLTVSFDLCGSTDPDGDPLSYFFDFGDGSQTSGTCAVSHTYTATSFRGPGSLSGGVSAKSTTYHFFGSVVDPSGASQSRARDVVVNIPPPTTTTTTTTLCPTPTVVITAPMGCVDVSVNHNVPVSADASNATNVHFSLDYIGFDCTYAAANMGMKDVAGTTNPYATSFDTTTIFFGGCFRLSAQASNACATPVSATPVVFNTNYGSCTAARLTTAEKGSLGWSSDLALDGGRLQIVVNGTSASFPGRGRAYGVASLKSAENRVEATVVEAAGKPGLWRFDVMNAENVAAGSLRVLVGEVVNIAASSITFRLRGTPGERVSFTFEKK